MDASRLVTASLRDPRVLRILVAVLEAADPSQIVADYLRSAPLPPHRRLFLLGLGKAALPMTRAAIDAFPDFSGALVITKRIPPEKLPAYPTPSGSEIAPAHAERFTILEAGHPIPDERSLAAGNAALRFVSRLDPDDLLICLISGGGSALATAPVNGVDLGAIRTLTNSLLASGANIAEINVLRRQLDQVKGGGLAAATRASILSLILSDVIGDHLEAIASGPTAPNPTSAADAISILRKYSLQPTPALLKALDSAVPGTTRSRFERVQNIILGNNSIAVAAAGRRAEHEGFLTELWDGAIEGEASLVGFHLAQNLRGALLVRRRPFCIIAGGETTVTITGSGMGGRNQELALAAVEVLAGLGGALLISLATDGEDGPTDAAGAVVTGETAWRAERLRMSAAMYLARNDAYRFFEPLGDLLKPGYTGTNVNDLIFLVGL